LHLASRKEGGANYENGEAGETANTHYAGEMALLICELKKDGLGFCTMALFGTSNVS
jgi:hypothetical protein